MYKELKTVCPHCQHEARRRVNLDTYGVGWNLQPVSCLKCTKGYSIAFEVGKEAGKKVLCARRVKGYYQMEVFQPAVKPKRVLRTDCYTRRVHKGEVLAVGTEVQVGCYRGRVAEVCQQVVYGVPLHSPLYVVDLDMTTMYPEAHTKTHTWTKERMRLFGDELRVVERGGGVC